MQHFDHPNVMSLVGVSLEGNVGGPCIIRPFMAKGSLLNYLRQEAEQYDYYQYLPLGMPEACMG